MKTNLSMKKFLIALVVLMISVMGLLVSCNKDDEPIKQTNVNPNATVEETTSVAFNISTPSKTTAKDVKRGTISVRVKNIYLAAVKVITGLPNLTYLPIPNGTPIYFTDDTFNLVPDNTANAQDYFSLDKVAIGTNNFLAATEAAGPEVFSFTTTQYGPWTSTAASNTAAIAKLNVLKAVIPYTIYGGSVLNKVITKPDAGIANNVSIPMSTAHGRISSVFNLEDLLVKLEYNATIKAEAIKPNGQVISSQTVVINGGDIAAFQWSNLVSLDGCKVKYTIVIRENGNATPLYTYDIDDANTKIDASISKSCHYIIDKTKVLVDLNESDDITFTWQPWEETECHNCQ